MKYLVDSDWVADYLKGRDHAVQLLDSLVSDGIAISIITYAELLEGIYFGNNPSHYEAVFRRFLRGVEVVAVTRSIAERYARVSGDLRGQGLLLSEGLGLVDCDRARTVARREARFQTVALASTA